MWSYENRLKAVELYISCGFSAGAVKSALGYPHTVTLRRWHSEYLATGKVKKSRTKWLKFTEEQKKVAVDHYLSNGKSANATVQALGYPSRPLLARWVDELAPSQRRKQRNPRSKQYSEAERAEIVASAYVSDKTITETIKLADIDKTTFYNWRNTILGKEAQAMVDDVTEPDNDSDKEELQGEIAELKAQIEHYRMETAVWKGAAEIVKKT